MRETTANWRRLYSEVSVRVEVLGDALDTAWLRKRGAKRVRVLPSQSPGHGRWAADWQHGGEVIVLPRELTP